MTPLRTEIEAILANEANLNQREYEERLIRIIRAAMGLYDVVDDNKKASEQGFQVYPLEKDILKALTAFEKAVRGRA